ncbi:MAG: hypothetical protein RMJ97_11340 [Raineya sp.]|nr:hypothetical protein [Raineya sp.]
MFSDNKDFLKEGIRKAKGKVNPFLTRHFAEPEQSENGKYLITYDFLQRNELLQLWANYKNLPFNSIMNGYLYQMEASEAKELGLTEI